MKSWVSEDCFVLIGGREVERQPRMFERTIQVTFHDALVAPAGLARRVLEGDGRQCVDAGGVVRNPPVLSVLSDTLEGVLGVARGLVVTAQVRSHERSAAKSIAILR
jgi:hypothetical protein